jgi:hypothetical protein
MRQAQKAVSQPKHQTKDAIMSNRREILARLTLGGVALVLAGCNRIAPSLQSEAEPVQAYSPEDQALVHKFRGVRGFELYMSGFGGSRDDTIRAIGVDDKGQTVVESAFATGGNSKHAGFWHLTGPYKYVDFKLYKGNTVKYHWDSNGIKTGVTGHLYGQWRVPVAERIPDDLLDDLRANPKGGLRIKFRFHPDGVLLGWDIQRRPGFDPKKRDKWGEAVYVAPVHSFAGGDFQEAEIVDGKVVRKGWYIHPKTKQRIEIDF